MGCSTYVIRSPSFKSSLIYFSLQKLHGVVRPLSLKTDVIKKRCVKLRIRHWFIAYRVYWLYQEPNRSRQGGCVDRTRCPKRQFCKFRNECGQRSNFIQVSGVISSAISLVEHGYQESKEGIRRAITAFQFHIIRHTQCKPANLTSPMRDLGGYVT